MAEIKITDKDSLKAWLETRSNQDAQIIALRAAARVLPLWAREMGSEWVRRKRQARQIDLTALPILRSLLTSGVARTHPTPEVKASAAAAYASASTASATPAAAAAYAAAYAADADYAAAAVAAMWDLIEQDANILQSGGELDSTPLWHGNTPEWFTRADAETRVIWDKDPAPWVFWRKWWDGVISGTMPFAPEVLRDIALIADDIWKQGPHAVAAQIARIELDRAIALSPNAEEILRDDTGQFYALPITTLDPALYRAAIEKVQDVIAEIRAKPQMANYISHIADDLTRLDDHFARYRGQPLRIHDVYMKTLRHLQEKTTEGLLPKGGLLGDLENDLDTGATDIRNADTEVAKTVKARVKDRLARMRAEDKAKTIEAMRQGAEEARDDLKAELIEDIAVTNDPSAKQEDKDQSSWRNVSRYLRMAKRRKDDTVKAMDDVSKVVKGAEAADKIIDAAPGWWDIIYEKLLLLMS